MKTKKNIPTNWSFFNEHGLNYTAYGLIGFIGQVLSGLSLLYAVYSLIIAKINAGGGQLSHSYLIVGLAAVVALFVELANRKLARPSIKPWVQKDLFKDDSEARQRHLILTRSYRVILCLVAGLSFFLSGVGSVEYAEDSAPPTNLVSIDSIKQAYRTEKLTVQQAFNADTALMAPVFQLRFTAAKNRFINDSLALMKERSKYQGCARKGNKWCKGQLIVFLGKIDESRKAMADSVAVISREQNETLQGFLNTREQKLNNLQTDQTAVVSEAKSGNADLITTSENDTSFKGLIFILLTIVGQATFYLMVYLQLQIEAGSGIEQEIEPNEFWDKPGIAEEINSTLSWRIERGIRRLIVYLFPEPDNSKLTDIPYWCIVKQENKDAEEEDENQEETSVPVSCSVKETRPVNQALIDAKSKLSIYRKRVFKHKQKAIVQKRQKGKVLKRTSDAILNNENWVKHWEGVVNSLSKAPVELNGHDLNI